MCKSFCAIFTIIFWIVLKMPGLFFSATSTSDIIVDTVVPLGGNVGWSVAGSCVGSGVCVEATDTTVVVPGAGVEITTVGTDG